MIRTRISDAALRAAKPANKSYKITVGGALYLEVLPSGTKSWRWKYRLAGRENRFVLGTYPDVGLSDARIKRDAARRLVKQGINPAHEQKLAQLKLANQARETFISVSAEWLERGAKKWTPTVHRHHKNMLGRYVLPSIGSLPMRQITPAHVLSIVKQIEHPTAARTAMRLIGAVSRLAVATLRADTDPTAPLRGSLDSHETEHHRALKAPELADFVRGIDTMPCEPATKAAFKLALWSLMRSKEVIGARWDEFDLEARTWTIPAERMKMREEHIIPLPHQAIAMLQEMQLLAGHLELLFPNRKDRRRAAAHTMLRRPLEKMNATFSPHSIRSTGSTMLNEMGYRADLIEKQLAHEERNASRRAYDRSTLIEERRPMMQQWADYLDALANGSTKKIVPLRAA
jgi:integrase